MKRGPDLDIEAIFDDLESDRPAPVVDDDVESDRGADALDDGELDDDSELSEEEWERG